jgi:hypothetical protein
MLTVLKAEGAHISFLCSDLRIDHKRPLEIAPLTQIVSSYAVARERGDEATLIDLGRHLYQWLDGKEAWLAELREKLLPPFIFEIQAALQPDASARTVLQAPWELLADGQGYLAENTSLGFAPARRLGERREAAKLDEYRLGIVFMAAAPEGVQDLDYEAEEAAILTTAHEGVDLYVEDSGDPEELGRRLSEFESRPPVLHLSCHGHNATQATPGAQPQPMLILEDAHGDARPTTAAGLIECLGTERPRLVMLSACLSAAAGGGKTAMADSLASALVRAGSPAVLGWDGSVADIAATQFARELYERLGKRQSVVEAAAGARRALLTATEYADSGNGKHSLEAPALSQQLPQQQRALRRDWHLARIWLGPEGGGPIVGGARKRSLLPADHEPKQVLKVKADERLNVANAAMFVGRRRELQRALRVLADNEFAGVLIHGMGRLGKSSLAARIANRRRDLALAVVYGTYDAMSILEALEEALKDHPAARELLKQGRTKVRIDNTMLEEVLTDLLAGPCRERATGKPVLLLIDDLERILGSGDNPIRRVRGDIERQALGAVLRAFAPERSESRLVVTSRFPFTLVEDSDELAARLDALQLPPLRESTRAKLSLRQVAVARTRKGAGQALDDTSLDERMPLLERAQRAARGNPGLQDLLGDRLVLRKALPLARVMAALDQIEAYLEGGALPAQEELREFLQNLALDQLLQEAGLSGQALLRASTVFELPVPETILAALAEEVGGTPTGLRDLGLLDPYRDVVEHEVMVLAVNQLVVGRLAMLSMAEEQSLASLGLPPLFAA